MLEVQLNPSLRRLITMTAMIVAGTTAYVATQLMPLWIKLWTPHGFERSLKVGVHWLILVVFLAVVALAPIVMAVSAGVIRRARRRRSPWGVAAKALALSLSCMLSALALEAGASAWSAWNDRLANLPVKFAAASSDRNHKAPLRLVVVGESSARGEPYDECFSVGRIVGWQLEKILDRRVEVEMKARNGLTLAGALGTLTDLTTRPDAILLYSGHNEFQGRFRWSRGVSHYATAEPYRPAQEIFLERVARYSSLCAWVRDSIERHWLDAAPPTKATRDLVDIPACSPRESAAVREEFKNHLEQFARYCRSIGTLAIMVIPPGNDVDFSPTRSVMSLTSTLAERVEFARDFKTARAQEKIDAITAESSYRQLLIRQPRFAECHYRLARLLMKRGKYDEARESFRQARDLDAMPLRCPTGLQDVYRDVAARNKEIVLVDGPAVLASVAPHGLLDDRYFHDAQHPNLLSYVTLSRSLLGAIHARGALGWPAGRATPMIGVDECASHFGMNAAQWAMVCRKSWSFYYATAYITYDPSERLAMSKHCQEESAAIDSGADPRKSTLACLSFLSQTRE